MNFLMHKQKPRPKVTPMEGYLAIGNGEAHFFSHDHKLLAELSKPEIMWAAAKGITIRGFEPTGHDRTGNKKFIYQEWFLRYPDEDAQKNDQTSAAASMVDKSLVAKWLSFTCPDVHELFLKEFEV